MGLALVLGVSSAAFAQTVPPPAPSVQTQTPTSTAKAPLLFPVTTKFAFVDFQRVASTSSSGKLAMRILQELRDKKATEIDVQNKQLQALTSKRDAGVLGETALAQLNKDLDKLQREIQFATQNAQAELQQKQKDLENDFQQRMVPIVAEIAKEKGLDAVFTGESGTLYINPALDISDEVIKRIDARAAK
jgi:outer membrane protein